MKNLHLIHRFLGVCVIILSIYLISAQLYSLKLQYIPGDISVFSDALNTGRFIDIPLDENEQAMFAGGSVVKRLYVHNNHKFILFRIDSGGKRKVLHNPRTCLMASGWRTSGEKQKADTNLVFTGLNLKNVSDGRDAGCLFWYELGKNRHSSHIGFNFDYIKRKLTFGNSAAPQSLFLLQSFNNSDSALSDLIEIAEMLQNPPPGQSNRSS